MPILIDGQEVDSSSEEWRAECEARQVAAMDSGTRATFLASVAKHRGAKAAENLRSNATAINVFATSAAERIARLPTPSERHESIEEHRQKFGDHSAALVNAIARRIYSAGRR